MHFESRGRAQVFPIWYFNRKRQFALGMDLMTGERVDLIDDNGDRVNFGDWSWESEDVADGGYGIPQLN